MGRPKIGACVIWFTMIHYLSHRQTSGTFVRFNDFFATVLSARAEEPWSQAVLWRQCFDLLAQFQQDDHSSDASLQRITETLRELSQKVGTGQKLSAISELGGRLKSPRLVSLLLLEEGPVQVAAMQYARLSDSEWASIIAEAGPLARSVLRQRSDLGLQARQALAAFGSVDMSLTDIGRGAEAVRSPSPRLALAAPARTAANDQSQIRQIVDRIERFNTEKQDRIPRDLPAPPAAEEGQEADTGYFTFLADADGVIQTSYGVQSGQISGVRLIGAAHQSPDSQMVRAFRRQGAFRDCRLTIAEGPLAGCWLVDGDPLFDQRNGRFTGYRGSARRAEELDLTPFVAAAEEEGISNAASMRQLIHELRSPLSGVMGFAELIENQLLGPVSDRYRVMAENIVKDVHGIVDILEDLDLANRSDRLSMPSGAGGSDAVRMMANAVEQFGRDENGRPRIILEAAADLPVADIAPVIADRMITHFVRSLAGCVGPESLQARCRQSGEQLLIEIDRPLAMAGLSDEQLFDSGCDHVLENADAPVLGVGFALRLVRRLAQANHGRLMVLADRFALSLPLLEMEMPKEASS